MTGKWAVAGVPHTGWSCAGISDLDDDRAVCEMCELAEIRYAHHMTHPGWPDSLAVGCICAGFMEQDRERAQSRERTFVNEQARRRTWLTRKWRRSRRGYEFLNTDGFNIVIYEHGGGWGSRITNRAGGEFWESRKYYGTSDAAKMGALTGLLWLLRRVAAGEL